MAIFDTLATPPSEAEVSFVSNNKVDQLIFAPIPAGNVLFRNGSGLDEFQDGDNVLIKKISIILPYQYGSGDWSAENLLGLEWRQNGIDVPITELGNASLIHLPANLCDSVQPNLRLAAPNVSSGDFALKLQRYSISISQIFAPDTLQGDTIFFGFQLEVEHTLPMV